MRRFLSLTVWAYAVWVVLTWTRTAEQLLAGLAIAVLVAVALRPLGEVAAPWNILRPRRLTGLVLLGMSALGHVVAANVKLSRRIWAPSRPLRSGMVIVPTHARTDGELAMVGLVSSLIVDNQIVDLDRDAHLLQYHAVDVPRDRDRAVTAINGPVERFLPALTGRPLDSNPDRNRQAR
jgi:multicomponent Na+:H+ antiporter subunit E